MPGTEQITKIAIPEVREEVLNNGINVHYLPNAEQNVVKIDLIFEAGYWYQPQAFVAGFTNSMLNAGTKTKSSAQIAEKLDFFGSYLKLDTGRHTATVSLFTLAKHLDSTISVLEDIVKNSDFPEQEFDTLLANRQQEFILSLEKSETVAHRQFSELLFGEDHPYGKMTSKSDFKALKREQICEFYNTYYTPQKCTIIVSGKVDDRIHGLLNYYFGQNKWRTEIPSAKLLEFKPFDEIIYYPGRELFLKRLNANQSSIRTGCLTVNQLHEDFPKLKVLNTLLGGYFGSRLMRSLREKNGYTYNVSSMLLTAKQAGSLWISTEVGTHVTKTAALDIFREVDKLSMKPVDQDELERVKNYMLGETLHFFDGPFATAELLKSYLVYGKKLSDFNTNIKAIRSVTPRELQKLSQKYLDTADFIEVIVGSMK